MKQYPPFVGVSLVEAAFRFEVDVMRLMTDGNSRTAGDVARELKADEDASAAALGRLRQQKKVVPEYLRGVTIWQAAQ